MAEIAAVELGRNSPLKDDKIKSLESKCNYPNL
jgi:hypothetical protein